MELEVMGIGKSGIQVGYLQEFLGTGQVVTHGLGERGMMESLGLCWVISVPFQNSLCLRQAKLLLDTMGISGSREC